MKEKKGDTLKKSFLCSPHPHIYSPNPSLKAFFFLTQVIHYNLVQPNNPKFHLDNFPSSEILV